MDLGHGNESLGRLDERTKSWDRGDDPCVKGWKSGSIENTQISQEKTVAIIYAYLITSLTFLGPAAGEDRCEQRCCAELQGASDEVRRAGQRSRNERKCETVEYREGGREGRHGIENEGCEWRLYRASKRRD